MTHPLEPSSVAVGIDGSDAAIDAAIWAVDEAAGWPRCTAVAGSRCSRRGPTNPAGG